MLTRASLIHALQLHSCPILYTVCIPQKVPYSTANFTDDITLANPLVKIETIDVRDAIIYALKDIDNQIDEAQRMVRKAQDELTEYKKAHAEFESFKRFQAEQGHARTYGR
jgi:hypothetical protein